MRLVERDGAVVERGVDELALARGLRSYSAIRMPMQAFMPVDRSTTGTPMRTGPLSGAPLTETSPAEACTIAS